VSNIIPGSTEDQEYARRLLSELRDLADWVKTVVFPVYTWRSECYVEVKERNYSCVATPYSPSVELDLKPQDITTLETPSRARELRGGDVVLVKYPEGAAELRWLHYTISSRDAKLAIYTTSGDFIKSDTVLSTPGFSFNPSSPPRTPAICISSEVYKVIREEPATIRVKSSVSLGESKTILAGVNGASERIVHIVSHRDSIIGDRGKAATSMLLKLVTSLDKSKLPYNIVIVSTTAREIGDYQFTEYHYTWGLRHLLGLLEARSDLNNTHAAIAIGPIYGVKRVMVAVHPALRRAVSIISPAEGVEVNLSYNHAQIESYDYVARGVPAITITSLPYAWWCHNSTLNCPLGDLDAVILDVAKRLLTSMLQSDHANLVRELDEHIVKSLGEAGVEARNIALRARSLSVILSPREYIREVSKLGYGVFYAMCNYPFKVVLNADMFAELSESATRTLLELLGECRGELVVGTSDWYVLTQSTSKGAGRLFSRAFIEKIVKSKDTLIDSCITRHLCLSVLKGTGHGVEEYRNKQVREL